MTTKKDESPQQNITLGQWSRVGLRFTQTLVKKLSECVDTNPAKVALSIIKVIMEINDVGYYFYYLVLADYYARIL